MCVHMQFDIRAATYRRENDECFIIGFVCPLFVMALICVSGLHEVLWLSQPLSLTVCVCTRVCAYIYFCIILYGMYGYVVGAKIHHMCCMKTWLLYYYGEGSSV